MMEAALYLITHLWWLWLLIVGAVAVTHWMETRS